jgi:putative addiction module antidote
MYALKLRSVGNSVGAILPREVLDRLHVTEGSTLYLTEAPDGVRLTPYSPEFEQQMAAAQKIMRNRRDALRELAK